MKIIELRPDLQLVKNNFDGYKLSLEQTPILKETIISPGRVFPAGSEFSFLHSSLFQLHNHLISDPWLMNHCYYIDAASSVQKICYDVTTGKLRPPISQFQFAITRPSTEGVYNSDFKFISEKFAALSDGVGNLLIIDTGDRQKNVEWKLVQSLQPLDGKGFIIQDGKFSVESEEKIINCLLLHVDQIDGKFHNIVDWITLKHGGEVWSLESHRTIQGKGSLSYLSLDPTCKAIVYCSNSPYKYTYDKNHEIIKEPDDVAAIPAAPENPQAEESETFQWFPNGDDITVNFHVNPNTSKEQCVVKCDKTHIEVKCQEQVYINSDIFAEIKSDSTTWTIDNGFMQLNLQKKDSELLWPYLIPGGPAEGLDEQRPVTNLNSQIEECDFDSEDFFIGKLSAIYCLN